MHLRNLLDLCQADHSEAWVVLPRRGALSGMLISILDHHDLDQLLESDEAQLPAPSLAIRRHHTRAVYAPIPQLGLAFGMPADNDGAGGGEFDWLPTGRWRADMTTLELAHVLLDGAPVWEVHYVSLARIDGAGAVLPWPVPAHGGEVNETTTWEASFVELISDLAEHTAGYDYQAELELTPITVRTGHPLDHQTHR
jgi:hypothetical protein